MSSTSPVFRELTREECETLLRRHKYGRIAFTFRDRVDIEPISFTYEDGWIIGRTEPGTKMTVMKHHPWVAFEIDEVEGPFSWRSVVAKGAVYLLEPEAASYDEAVRARAVTAIRRLLPSAFTEDDPFPGRTLLFRLHVDVLHGRACTPGDS